MKQFLTLTVIIICCLMFPVIGKAQEKPVAAQKPIAITPANIVVEPTIVVDKPAKVSAVSGTPLANTVVVPVVGNVAAKPAESIVAPKAAINLKIAPAPVNMDKPKESTILIQK